MSKSGCHGFLGRRKSNAQTGREALERFVAETFDRHGGRYGYRRINRELRRSGIVVSEKRFLNVMRRLGLQAKGATRRHRGSRPVEKGDPRVSLANRVFDVDSRNRLWVGNITCIPASEGWPCLAAVVDAWHRKVVGWSMSDRITEKLAIDALEQAVGREDPPSDCSLAFHDDQGVQYVFGNGFLDTLAARFRQSGKRTADASDFCLPEHQGLVHPLARAVELDEPSMVDHPVDHRGGKLVVAQDRSPFAELDVGGEHHASLLVAC